MCNNGCRHTSAICDKCACAIDFYPAGFSLIKEKLKTSPQKIGGQIVAKIWNFSIFNWGAVKFGCVKIRW